MNIHQKIQYVDHATSNVNGIIPKTANSPTLIKIEKPWLRTNQYTQATPRPASNKTAATRFSWYQSVPNAVLSRPNTKCP